MACCTLHSFLCKKRQHHYISAGSLDQERTENGLTELGDRHLPNTLFNLEVGHSRNSWQSAKDVRQLYVNYFCNDGTVPWQSNFI